MLYIKIFYILVYQPTRNVTKYHNKLILIIINIKKISSYKTIFNKLITGWRW